MENIFCALGCSPNKILYMFPSRKHDGKRRKAWLDFFDMEEPNIEYVFACNRHFSHLQTTADGLRTTAVPDIPIICDGAVLHFRRKPKNWRKNVVVVTPRDPEFTIYRRETGIFPQSLFNVSDAVQPVIKMPIIKSVSCSMSTQTNTRLCGLVEISDIKEEYRLNCFYCSEMFAIEKWSKFVDHLKKSHFKEEEAFKMRKYLSQDHDYTSIGPPSILPVKSSTDLKLFTNTSIKLQPYQPIFLDPIVLPPLLAKPLNGTEKPQTILKNQKSPPPLLANPHQSNDKPFNISLADQLINLLNETVLSPRFLHTEEDNILIIKNTGSDNIETSNFLTKLMDTNTSSSFMSQKPVFSVKPKNPTLLNTSSKNTRPIYTINYGQQHIPSRRQSFSRDFLPPLPKIKKSKLVQKRIAQRTLKYINDFENVYKAVKTRYPKVVEILNHTPLSHYLKRNVTDKIETPPRKPKCTEIVFEYTPKDIIVSLLENMKNYPVLWEFHDQPFNKDYNKAIEELCRIINDKWSLNITLLKMRRSLNRILRFYRFMLSYESIDKFEDYFDKCAMFLPSSIDEIPRARCPYCCVCYKKDNELRKHLIERHKSLKWPHKCTQCLERFRESDEYELHKLLPHYEEVFKCEQCDRRFNRRHLYNKHVDSHQRTKERRIEAAAVQNPSYIRVISYVCKVCNRTFSSEADLNRHKITHREPKKNICHLCSKELCSKMSLKLHMKRHRKELDYICEVCGKGFIRQAYLNEHMDTHTGAKISCKICNLKLRKCSLSRHLRLVHIVTEGTIESTFRAKSHRYKKFQKPGQTRKRSSEKTPRQYGCKICKIPFVRLKLLKDHNKQIHSDVKRISCQMCDIEFIHRHNLKRHYRAKHKLHMYQVFKLVDQNEDLSTVLAMKPEELENMSEAYFLPYSMNNQQNVNKLNDLQGESYFEQERMHSDKIQDEIMKAVENIDKQEIKVDDDHSMNDFFTDLLK